MRTFKGFKWTRVEPVEGSTFATMDIDLPDGSSWYDLMLELDDRPEKWLVGVSTEHGWVSYFTDGPVSGQYAPQEEITVLLLDSIPFTNDDVRDWLWNGSEFVKRTTEQPKERTKEDIMRDLLALQEELKKL